MIDVILEIENWDICMFGKRSQVRIPRLELAVPDGNSVAVSRKNHGRVSRNLSMSRLHR
jgi:hypothetical protein